MAQVDVIPYGFKVGVEEPIDTRLVLKKVEMEAISNNYLTTGVPMPDRYIALCSDDNKLYEYDSSRTAPWGGSDIGKFSPIETVVDAYAKYYDINGKLITEQIITDKVINVDLTPFERKDNLATSPTTFRKVAETGSYSDLVDTPTIGEGTVTFKPQDNVGTQKLKEYLFNADGTSRLTLTFNANETNDIPWNLPTALRTSNYINDGNDGSSPFETKQEVVDQLIPYSLIEDTGYLIEFVEDSSSPREYSFHAELKNKDGVLLSKSTTIDLPLETAVQDVVLDSTNKKLIVERINGSSTYVDLQLAVTAFDLATKAYVDSEGASAKALITKEENRAKAREAELESDKEQVIVPVAPITKVADTTDPKKIDVGLDINSSSLEISSGKLNVNLSAGDALERVAVASAADEFNVLVDDKTVKIDSDNKLSVPFDGDTIYVDTDGKIKGTQQMGVLHGEYVHPTYGNLGAATLIDNPDPSIYGSYKKLLGVNVDGTTVTINSRGQLVASAALLTDVMVNGRSVLDSNPSSPTYTKALVKIESGVNNWITYSSEGALVITSQELELGDGLRWASGSTSKSKNPILEATGVPKYYSSLLNKPHLSLNGNDVEINNTIELDGSVAAGGLGLIADNTYKPTSTWFTSGVAVASAIQQFKNSLDSKAQADSNYALSYIKMEDGQLSKVSQIKIPTVNDGTLTLKKNGTILGTFSADNETDVEINIVVPTLTSDLTNDGPDSTTGDKYTVVSETGNKVDLSLNTSTFALTSKLLDKNNNALSQKSVTLPIKDSFIEVKYVEKTSPETKQLIFTSLDGTEHTIDMKAVVDEYEKLSNKLKSTDTISSGSTDDQYASAKLIYNTLSKKEDKLPSYEKNKYLHVNETSGELEWSYANAFVIVDNTTSLTDIADYYSQGKIVFAKLDGNLVYALTAYNSTAAVFEAITGAVGDEIVDKKYTVTAGGWSTDYTKKAMNYVDYSKTSNTDEEKVLAIKESTTTAGTYEPTWAYPTLKTLDVSITTAGWSTYGSGYTKNVAAPGVDRSRNPIVSLSIDKASTTSVESQRSEWSKIYCIETQDNALVLYATAIPTVNLLVTLAGY